MRGASVGYSGALEGASLYTSHLAQKYVAESGTKRMDLAGPHLDRDFGWATHAAQRREVVGYLHSQLARNERIQYGSGTEEADTGPCRLARDMPYVKLRVLTGFFKTGKSERIGGISFRVPHLLEVGELRQLINFGCRRNSPSRVIGNGGHRP